MPRANRGTSAAITALDGDWNSRMAGSVGAPPSSTIVLIALDEGRSESCMAWTLAVERTVLLRPELAVDGAAFKQDAVRRDVHHLALFQHEDLVAFCQR